MKTFDESFVELATKESIASGHLVNNDRRKHMQQGWEMCLAAMAEPQGEKDTPTEAKPEPTYCPTWEWKFGTEAQTTDRLTYGRLMDARAIGQREGFASCQSQCLAIVERVGNDAWSFPAAKMAEEIRALGPVAETRSTYAEGFADAARKAVELVENFLLGRILWGGESKVVEDVKVEIAKQIRALALVPSPNALEVAVESAKLEEITMAMEVLAKNPFVITEYVKGRYKVVRAQLAALEGKPTEKGSTR